MSGLGHIRKLRMWKNRLRLGGWFVWLLRYVRTGLVYGWCGWLVYFFFGNNSLTKSTTDLHWAAAGASSNQQPTGHLSALRQMWTDTRHARRVEVKRRRQANRHTDRYQTISSEGTHISVHTKTYTHTLWCMQNAHEFIHTDSDILSITSTLSKCHRRQRREVDKDAKRAAVFTCNFRAIWMCRQMLVYPLASASKHSRPNQRLHSTSYDAPSRQRFAHLASRSQRPEASAAGSLPYQAVCGTV